MKSTRPNRISTSTLHRSLRFSRRSTARLIRRVLSGERESGWSVGVAFVNDARMRRLHQQFLSRRRTTDVLSFGSGTPRDKEGEIVVNLDQARRQAPMFGTSYSDETARLIVHGLLHLLGYDDRTASKRRDMKEREDRYLNGYA